MRTVWIAVFNLASAAAQTGPPPDGAAIMARVAANMESSLEARRQYVYHQNVRVRMVRTNGRKARDERREYTALPGPERTEKKMVSLAGEYHKSTKEIVRYTDPGFRKGGMDLDGELIEGLINDLVNDGKSRDGIPHSLFPLATRDLPAYKFRFKETIELHGRKTHRIAFEPSGKSTCQEKDCDSRPWKGEALIDAEEFQPVKIATDLSFKVPWGVKVFLGSNLRQMGFSVSYARVAPEVWFPASYGSEFRLDVLFGYKRVITMAMDSRDFRKTDVVSGVKYETEEK